MAFVLQNVIKELERSRSLEPLKKLKKEDLAIVAAHFGITPCILGLKCYCEAFVPIAD